MCGICGIVNPIDMPVNRPVLEQMCAVLQHRGPDESGQHISGNVGLGHRRLSIIDLSTGSQPLSNEDGTIWIVLNGEIYNFIALRSELERHGHRFATKSDTEVIVHLYEELGEKCVDRLRGMFAFAIWDARSRQLMVARDRLGKKPVYFTSTAGSFLFASEMKSLLQHPAVEKCIRPAAIVDFMAYLYIPDPGTIFENIQKLLPGHYVIWRDGRATVKQYWDLSFDDNDGIKIREEEAAEELRRILAESVRIRMVSDVPLGAFLSGGIDSSAVVAMMAKASSSPVKTFSIGFKEQDFNELPFAREVSRMYGTDHREFIVDPDAAAIIDELAWFFDEPFADSSAIPTYYVCKIAREAVTVALSGDGGDELFAGYERYLRDQRYASFGKLPRWLRRGVLAPAGKWLPESAYGKNLLRHVAMDDRERYIHEVTGGVSDQWEDLFSTEFISETKGADPASALLPYFAVVSKRDFATQRLYVDTKSYLPGDILTKVDRMSMAVSLEARAPLLDHELVEFVSRLPVEMKMKGRTTKYILREATKDLLPASVVGRKKMGFAVPVSKWFNQDWTEVVDHLLLEQRAIQRGYFNPRFIRRVVDEHRRGRRNHESILWPLMMLELWHRKFIDSSPLPPYLRKPFAELGANRRMSSAG